jgi:ATP-dependent DNA helicase RecG
MDAALAQVGDSAPEVLPDTVRGARPARGAVLRNAHFPVSLDEAEAARRHLALEELFVLEASRLRDRAAARGRDDGIRLDPARGLQGRYLAALPFALTAAQRRVLDEIDADVASGRWMQRLVLGDVGAGKTVIAVAAAFLAIGNGWQAALMAPTEPLALQHAERLGEACGRLGVRLGVLVGSRAAAEKDALRAAIAAGDIDLVVGTHALAQENLRFARLGLAVVDEQQRFGVLQRAALYRGETRPHVLVLSATPIPRTLAATLCGDLDLSRLDEKPPGRTPVRTRVVPAARREALWNFVRAELEAGRQGYVVLPLIDESDALELRAARDEYDTLRQGPLAGLPIALLHGRLPAAEREATLAAFHAGRIRLLVCTSVVEVGLDVAPASVVVVHHPERFGLAQLHQLRGRVGRGDAASWCFLLPGTRAGAAARERLQRFAATDDGFQIAELDLETRGPGDLAGTRQHGALDLRVADLARDVELLVEARDMAARVLASDPELERPEHAALRAHLDARVQNRLALAWVG